MASAGFKSCEEQEFRFESKDATSSPHRTGVLSFAPFAYDVCSFNGAVGEAVVQSNSAMTFAQIKRKYMSHGIEQMVEPHDGDTETVEVQVCVKKNKDERTNLSYSEENKKFEANNFQGSSSGAEDDPVLKRNLCPGSDETESNICGDEIPTGAKQTLCTSNSDVWSVLETDLFEKALQIFGKNR